MTAPADLAAIRAALDMAAKATPGPLVLRVNPCPPASIEVFDVVSPDGRIIACCCSADDSEQIDEANAAAIVALRNAAPAIAAAVEELEDARAETARQRETIRAGADAVRSANASTTEIGCRLDDAGERIAALERQVCRLVSGQEIDGDRLCQHHGADVAALALLADERAAHAETSRDLDALLTALGAQVTPGGQTLDACHARRVAHGMRLAKLASASARHLEMEHIASKIDALGGIVDASDGDLRGDGLIEATSDVLRRAKRAVPADVEAAIASMVAAARDATNYETDRATVADHLTAERFVKESIAALRAAIAAEIERARAEGRSEAPAAPATVARPISEWHEGMVGWLLATEPNGAIIEYERDEPGKFAQIENASGKFWRCRAWAGGKWWVWCDVSVIDANVIKRPARLVPASEADADPASRGPICGGGR